VTKASTRLLAICIGYLILSLVLTYPVSWELDSVLPGDHEDTYFHLWNYWWFHQALMVEDLDPMFCPYVLYPTGCELTLHSYSLTNALPAAVMSEWVGVVVSYNLLTILGFFLAALGMYFLAWEITGSVWGSFWAGFIFSFSPYHYQHLSRPDSAGIQWLPLAVLYLLRLWRRPRWLDSFGFAVFFLLASYSSWYYMVTLTLITCVIGITFLIGDHRRVLNRRSIVLFIISVALITILLAPALIPMIVLRQQGEFGATSLLIHTLISADPVALLTPSFYHPAWRWLQNGIYQHFTGTEKNAYLGWVATAVALYGVLGTPRRTRFLWIGVGGFFLLLAFGPVLHWAGRYTWELGPVKYIPMPYLLLYKIFPPAQVTRAPIRFLVVVYMVLALFVAFALRRLQRRPVLVGIIGILLVIDYLAIPYPVLPTEVPAFYHELATEPGEFAVLEVPVTDYPSSLQLYQTVHGRAIPMGAITHIPPWRFEFLGSFPVVRELVNPGLITSERTAELAGLGRMHLRGAGFRYLIFHPDMIKPEAVRIKMQVFIDAVIGQAPVYQDGEILVYRCDTGAP